MSTIIQSKKTLLTVALGSLIAIVLAFGSFAASAKALTSSQVDAILGLLESFGADQATMDDVEAALTGEAPSRPATPVDELFTRDLTLGSTGADVKRLQQWLNAEGYTVAMTGAGSAGNETDYFGQLTRQALAAYQAANNISPAVGYFGPITRSSINVEVHDDEPANDEPANDEPANDEPADDDDEEEDDDEDEYGREGTIDVEQRSDQRNVEVGMNQTKDVATFRVDAENSKVNIRRIDIYVVNDATADYDVSLMEFRNDIDNLAIKVDGDVVAETAINRSTIDRDDEYVRFGGLDIDVARGGYVDFTIEVTASDNETPDSATYEIGPMKASSIRGVDSAGINIYTLAVTGIEFELTGEESGELDVTKNNDSPDEQVVVIEANGTNQEDRLVHLLSFDIEVGDSDIDLETLTVSITDTVTAAGGIVQDIILKEGSTMYYEDLAATVDFDDLDMELYSGETVNFEVWADVKITDVDEQGGYLVASVNAVNNTSIAYDMSDNLVDLDGNATGEAQAVYVVTPLAELADSTIEANAADNGAGAFMAIDVTAVGGDVYFLDSTAMAVSSTWTVDSVDYDEFDIYSVGTVIVETGVGLELDADNDVFDGTDVDVSASTTDTLTTLNDALLDLGYEDGDYVYVIGVGAAGTNGVYEVAATTNPAIDRTASHTTDTLYHLSENTTKTAEIYASITATGWLQLEVTEFNWYAKDDDGAFYDFQFDNNMEDLDVIETSRVNI